MSKYGYYLGMTPEQQDIVKMIREFAERELDPVVKEYDEKGEFPVQLHEKWGEMGLFGLDVRTGTQRRDALLHQRGAGQA